MLGRLACITYGTSGVICGLLLKVPLIVRNRPDCWYVTERRCPILCKLVESVRSNGRAPACGVKHFVDIASLPVVFVDATSANEMRAPYADEAPATVLNVASECFGRCVGGDETSDWRDSGRLTMVSIDVQEQQRWLNRGRTLAKRSMIGELLRRSPHVDTRVLPYIRSPW